MSPEPSRRPPQQSRNRCSLSSPRPGRACTGKHNGGKPQSTSTGQATVNAYQMMTGPHPVYRMSQGIQCPGPTLTVSPFVTGARNFDLPFESLTRTPVYSTADADDNGEPDNPGKVLYYSELPRFEKDRRSLNYGITATFSVPLITGLRISAAKLWPQTSSSRNSCWPPKGWSTNYSGQAMLASWPKLACNSPGACRWSAVT